MAHEGWSTLSFGFALCGFVLIFYAQFDKEWKTSEDTYHNSKQAGNLWEDCNIAASGTITCTTFGDSLFMAVSPTIIAGRILSIFSITFSGIALIMTSLSWMLCLLRHQITVKNLRTTSCALNAISSVAVIIVVGIYAYDITKTYYVMEMTTNVRKMILGRALIIGLVGGILLLASSIISFVLLCRKQKYVKYYPAFVLV